jgi:hypothetical protein
MTKFATLAFSMATLFSACAMPEDNGTSTAGVLTETESGHTVAFAISEELELDHVMVPKSAKKSGKVQFALTRIVDGKTKLMDSATVEYGDYAVFEDITGAYSVVATVTGMDGEKDTLYGADILKRNDVDTVVVGVRKPATLQISTDYKIWENSDSVSVFAKGDTLCITGTLACKQVTKENIKQGYVTLGNIPLFNNGDVAKQIEISNGEDFRAVGVTLDLNAGDTLFVDNVLSIKHLYDIELTLPKSDLFDSLGEYSLDSLIVPIHFWYDSKSYIRSASYYTDKFIDAQNNILLGPRYSRVFAEDSFYAWYVIPKMDSTTTLTAFEGDINWDNVPSSYDRIREFVSEPVTDSLLTTRKVFTDSSFALSFWFELDSLEKDGRLFYSGTDSLGFEIRRCEKDSTALCARIYNGIDTVSTDSIEYGKASVIDGKRHHYSFVIHKKHLTIAIDGETVRDTDLKLSTEFFKLEEIYTGSAPAQDVMLYSFGDFIKYKSDKNWTRLKAWLYAFYEMQK